MKDNKKNIRRIVYSGIIAALYVILTLPMAQFAFGPIQFRLAEVLTVLPAFTPGFIPGVTLGCFLANLLNPTNLGPVDIIGGTVATLIAGILSGLIGKKNKYLAIIPPILVNGVIVGGYLPFLLVDADSEVTAAAIGLSMFEVAASEAVLLAVIGIPLIIFINKTPSLKGLIEKV
ncbi:MAG: QueT transporter family protein [Clostridiales bacterium]|nr:QueT transporter family protein [Clostridiales bacterium]